MSTPFTRAPLRMRACAQGRRPPRRVQQRRRAVVVLLVDVRALDERLTTDVCEANAAHINAVHPPLVAASSARAALPW